MDNIRLGPARILFPGDTDYKSSANTLVDTLLDKEGLEPLVDMKPVVSEGMSIWSLILPTTKTKEGKSISPELFETAKARIELFCSERDSIEGTRTPSGYSMIIPDKLAPELLNFVRISGATMSKYSSNRKQRRAGV